MNKNMKKKIEKLKDVIRQSFDHATKQIIYWKDKRNEFKGGLITLEMLLQEDKNIKKVK